MTFLVDKFAVFRNATAIVKRLVFAGLCLALPWVGVGISVLIGTQVWNDGLVWPLIMAGLTAFGTGTTVHGINRAVVAKLTAK